MECMWLRCVWCVSVKALNEKCKILNEEKVTLSLQGFIVTYIRTERRFNSLENYQY